MPKFSPGGIDRKTGKIDTSDTFRFTTDFKDLGKITGKYGRRRLQISKLLGYQGIATRSWQMTVAWFDAGKNFISAETAWQYREMWIPEKAAFLKLGAYNVGKIGFYGCAVSGSQSLVDVFDMRSLSLPANTDPAKNPDRQPGTIELQGIKWSSAAKTELVHAKGGSPQSKKITILDKGNTWPEGVDVINDLPPSWCME